LRKRRSKITYEKRFKKSVELLGSANGTGRRERNNMGEVGKKVRTSNLRKARVLKQKEAVLKETRVKWAENRGSPLLLVNKDCKSTARLQACRVIALEERTSQGGKIKKQNGKVRGEERKKRA